MQGLRDRAEDLLVEVALELVQGRLSRAARLLGEVRLDEGEDPLADVGRRDECAFDEGQQPARVARRDAVAGAEPFEEPGRIHGGSGERPNGTPLPCVGLGLERPISCPQQEFAFAVIKKSHWARRPSVQASGTNPGVASTSARHIAPMGTGHVILVASGLAVGILVSAFAQRPADESQAGTALKMDLEEVVGASGLVLEGKVLGGHSAESPEGAIYTDWEIAVDRTWWGEDQPTRTVRLPGGVLATGKGMAVPGMPSLVPGEDVVLMLTEASENGLRVPTGLGQGKYRIVADAQGAKHAVRTGEHLTLATSTGALAGKDGLTVLDYAELVAKLEAATQAKRATAPASPNPAETPEER